MQCEVLQEKFQAGEGLRPPAQDDRAGVLVIVELHAALIIKCIASVDLGDLCGDYSNSDALGISR